jgi:hypothetical protein
MAYAAAMPYASSADIRSAAISEWEAATGHRLFREIIADTISDDDFERYLRIEFAFIDTAAVALGAAVRLAACLHPVSERVTPESRGDRQRGAMGADDPVRGLFHRGPRWREPAADELATAPASGR